MKFIANITQDIPDQSIHLVRFYARCSNRIGGDRLMQEEREKEVREGVGGRYNQLHLQKDGAKENPH